MFNTFQRLQQLGKHSMQMRKNMQKCHFSSALLPFVVLLFPLLLSLSSLTSANVQLLEEDITSYIYNFLSDQANRAWTTQLTITITAFVLVFVLVIVVIQRLRQSRAPTTGATVSRAGKAHPAPQAQVFTSPATSVQGGVLCPYCGFDNVQGAKFCVKCGKTL